MNNSAATGSQESRRVRKFRLEIAKAIPRFPNDKNTLSILEAKPLASLLIDYMNWACRLIPTRPRKVSIAATLTSDKRWKALAANTKVLLDKVRRGDDLTPHLSLKAIRNGFTPTPMAPSQDKWEDKDFLLVVMGYHHLHLGPFVEAGDQVARTGDVLFAQVNRTDFDAIAFFDHSVFEPSDTVSLVMTKERERLWDIHDSRTSFGMPPGVYVDRPIATSGHFLVHVRMASEYARIITAIDPKLENSTLRQEVFRDLPYQEIREQKLEWAMKGLDLGLLDKASATFHVLRRGPI